MKHLISILLSFLLVVGAFGQSTLSVNQSTGAILGPVSAATFKSANGISTFDGYFHSLKGDSGSVAAGNLVWQTSTSTDSSRINLAAPIVILGDGGATLIHNGDKIQILDSDGIHLITAGGDTITLNDTVGNLVSLSSGTGIALTSSQLGSEIVLHGNNGVHLQDSDGIDQLVADVSGVNISSLTADGFVIVQSGLLSSTADLTAFGAVFPTSITATSHQFLTSFTSGTGNFTKAQPSFSDISSTAGVAQGGTNISSYAIGDIIYASGSTTLSKLADVAVGSVLISGGVGVAPSWSSSLLLSGTLSVTGAVTQTAKTTTYNNIVTAGNGLVAVVKSTRVTAQSAANNSICTYTAPASDGSYEVSMNMNLTAVTAVSATLNCDYTDEANTARTMIFPVQSLAGNFVTGGLITTTGPYETPVMHIRCKASTAIKLYTSSGTYTGVTYTAEGIIKQMQ